jgi:tetratricopeptide (TPR) repeat protein
MRPSFRLPVLFAATLLAGALGACADDPLADAPEVAAAIERSRVSNPDAWQRKIILIGMDACDPDIVEEYIRRGKLPNFARMRREGAHGELRSLTPLLSPVIWTTISTGVPPERHGILDFVTETPEGLRPVSAKMRQADTVWELVAQAGEPVGVVGWLVSWPAEPINGFVVTDRVARLAYEASRFGESDEKSPQTVYPPEIATAVARDRVTIDDLPLSRMRAFVDVSEEEYADAYTQSFGDPRNLLGNLRLTMADAETFRAAGTRLYRESRPRLFACYFNAMDALKHMFMPLAPPQMPHIPDELFLRFRDVIEANYVWHDRVLGEYMDLADENTTVIVVSDHGFKHGSLRTQDSSQFATKTGAAWHRRYGVIYMWGGGVKAGHRIDGASVWDVAPTLLAALGYPVPEEMPGDALAHAFEDGLPHETVETWFGERRRLRMAAEAAADAGRAEGAPSPEEQEELAKLHALGYVSGDRNDPASTTLNLGARLLATRRYQRAIEEYEKLLTNPKQAQNTRVVLSLVRARLLYADVLRKRSQDAEADEQLDAAEEALLRAERSGANEVGILQLRSRLARERGNLDNAELLARTAAEREPLQAAVHTELAEVLRLQMEKARDEGRHEDAETYQQRAAESLRRALEREPRQFHTLTELARIELASRPRRAMTDEQKRRHLIEAAERALRLLDDSVRLIPESPKALNNRAIAQLRLGIGAKQDSNAPAAVEHLEDALASVETALRVQPEYPIGWANKAYILWHLDRMEAAHAAALEARRLDPGYRFNRQLLQALADAGTPLPPPPE